MRIVLSIISLLGSRHLHHPTDGMALGTTLGVAVAHGNSGRTLESLLHQG
jgi:hypothetical protein